MNLKDRLRAVLAIALLATLAACGGGGDGDNSNNGNSNNSSNANTVPITVGKGLSGVFNIPSVSVTICAPNSTSNCQTIDNIQLDTGSFGLRVASSALNTSMLNALPISTVGNNAQLAECATFADGFTWGSVRTATIKMGGETTTTAVAMQIIGDKPASTVPPNGCGSGPAENTVSDLGANGVLGVGTALTDCGATCADQGTAQTYSNYFACPGGTSCLRTAVPLAQQIANPVAKFAGDNNGVIVQMQPVPDTGAPSATGTLVFGINTQSNNGLGGAQVFTTDAFGDLNNSTFNGTTVQAFLDSGSNAYFFTDGSLPQCNGNFTGFYCPNSAQTRSIKLVGLNKATTNASIGILSAAKLLSNTGNYAFNNVAGQIGGSTSFDLGLPFFYGRHVYYGFDNGSQSPFIAF